MPKSDPPGTSQGSLVEYIYSFLRDVGLSAQQAAGVMGNIQVESAGTWSGTAYNPNENAIGISQWEGSRRTALDTFAQQRKKPETDLLTQLEFLVEEAQSRGNWQELKKYSDPAAAAAYWDANYEVSSGAARQERMDNAQTIYQHIQAGTLNQIKIGGISLDPGGGVHPGPGDVYQQNPFQTISKDVGGFFDKINPIHGIDQALKIVFAPMAFFFEKLGWIFNQNHFYKALLYFFGILFIFIGIGMLFFGAGKERPA